MAQANNNAKVKAEAEARAKAEAEREVRREQARINAAAKAEVERLRKKNENEKKKSTMKPLTRNTLVRNLANLKEPALDPLRDAIMSLSDPSFLNKKFNEEVYRGLPLRVKDFIGLSANQVTRAVIISKIIEAVKIGRERNAKAKNVSDNMGLAKTLVKAVNGLNKSKPGVATTNRAWSIKQKTPVNATTGTTPKPNMKPVATVTTTPQGPPPPPPTPPPPIQPINKNASKKAQAKNAAEAAAKAAINRQIRLIENRLEKLNNPANLIAEFETLKTKRSINNLTSFSNKVESFQQGPEKAASGQPNRSNTPAVPANESNVLVVEIIPTKPSDEMVSINLNNFNPEATQMQLKLPEKINKKNTINSTIKLLEGIKNNSQVKRFIEGLTNIKNLSVVNITKAESPNPETMAKIYKSYVLGNPISRDEIIYLEKGLFEMLRDAKPNNTLTLTWETPITPSKKINNSLETWMGVNKKNITNVPANPKSKGRGFLHTLTAAAIASLFAARRKVLRSQRTPGTNNTMTINPVAK